MTVLKLEDMVRGWFVGPFEPSAYSTDAVEVAIQTYRAGDTEPRHVHRVATEISVVVSGEVRMAERRLAAGDIVVLAPGEPTDFEAVTDAVVAAVKLPAVPGDKHLVEE